MSHVLTSQNRSSESDGSSGNKQYLSMITHSKYIFRKIISLFPLIIRFVDSQEHKGSELRATIPNSRRYKGNKNETFDTSK